MSSLSRPPVPTVPKPITTVPQPTVQVATRPIIPRPTLQITVQPTVPRPTTPIVPRPITVTTPTVPRPTTPTAPRTRLIVTPTIGQPAQITTPVQQHITFTPEMIDDDTIIQLANTLDRNNFLALLQLLDEYYHNDEGLISDERYDEVIAIYEAKYGRYGVVGAQPRGEMVDLPHYLGSLRKVKEEAELNNWLSNYPGPYIIEDKIDGVTILIYSRFVRGQLIVSAYSRGGGVRGKDISHILPYLPIPQINIEISIRGELVMHKDTFQRVGAGYKNARNLVSGLIGSKTKFNPDMAKELSLYAYRVVNKNQSPEDDIKELMGLGFQVPNPVSAVTLTKEILTNYFNTRKEQAPYEVDGLVIYQNRVGIYPENDEPRHVVAFKTTTETAVTTVRNVVWRGSKRRLLKPRVYYDTTLLSGADLNYASGYNARFIVANGIGPGAEILLTRSGDTIPKILTVIKPAPGGPDLPDPNTHGNYTWDTNQVEFILTEDNIDVTIGQLKHFLDTLKIKNAGRKRIEALVTAGITDIDTLLRVTPSELSGISGIGPTLSYQLYNDIRAAVTNVSLPRILDASGFFPGIGEGRFENIVEVYPDLLSFVNLDRNEAIRLLQEVRGIKALAFNIIDGLPDFVQWLNNNPSITIRLPQQIPTTIAGNRLAGQTFVFSGFRDDSLEGRIKAAGGKVTTSVSRNTSMVILKDLSPANMKGKAQKAQSLGIPIIARADFERQYL